MGNKEAALIIFQKNAELGKVKTRLAATIGDEKALAVYNFLVRHTHSLLMDLPLTKFLYYSSFLETEKTKDPLYHFRVQRGADLGERMLHACKEVKSLGYEKIGIIGTDCLELTTYIVQQAFDQLDTHDCVAGPAKDGGYYLLGMNTIHEPLFRNKQWSTGSVLSQTLADISRAGLTTFLLPELTDIDTESDLGILKRML